LKKWLQDQKEGLDEEMRMRKKEEDKLKEDFVEVCDEKEIWKIDDLDYIEYFDSEAWANCYWKS